MQALANPLTLVHGLAMLALVSITYGFMARTVSSVLSRGVAVGLTFGLGAISTMSDPIVMQEGVFIDARGVILTLAGPFGGVTAAVISAACAIAYRLWLGGAGAPIGCMTILVATGVGLAFAHFVPLHRGAYSLRQLVLLAAFGSLHGFSVLFVLMFIPVPGLVGSLLPLSLLNTLGIVVLGSFLSAEGRRRHATRRLEREAATDALTDLPNRRAFDAAGAVLVQDARATGRPVALLMVDLDHFKQVNDRWGHDAGDRVLSNAAKVIASAIREEDLAARYGGEEIAVLMPNTTEHEGLAIAERIRMAVHTNAITPRLGMANITVSIGVASAGGETIDFHGLFEAADRALYDAKRAGRNCCVIAGSDVRQIVDRPVAFSKRSDAKGSKPSPSRPESTDRETIEGRSFHAALLRRHPT